MLSTQMFGFGVKNDSFEPDSKQRLMVTFPYSSPLYQLSYQKKYNIVQLWYMWCINPQITRNINLYIFGKIDATEYSCTHS